MSGSLFHILNMGGESLMNSRIGIDVTGHNIANAHTPGFSRQRMVVSAKEPTQVGAFVFGNGATVQNIERAHDKYLETQLRNEIQMNGQKEALVRGFERLESLFNPELQSTVRERLNAFFNSLRELSNFPDEIAVRTHVAESAHNLTLSFRNTHASLVTIQKDINDEITSEIGALNKKIEEVAKLNMQIQELSAGAYNKANDLLDRRDLLVKEIAKQIDLQVYADERGSLTLRGPGGTLLVERGHAAQLRLDPSSDPIRPQIILIGVDKSSQTDITELLSSGNLGGLITMRDKFVQPLRDELNNLARTFFTEFNAIHQKGYGIGTYEDKKGRNFFEGLDTPEPAASVQVSPLIMAEPQSIATGLTPEAPGDNIVVNELLKLTNAPLFDGGRASVFDCYDRFVGQLGVNSMRAQQDLEAGKVVLSQLQSQREAIAGVSLDEEAQNLLKYQHLFTASSKLITTVDEMFKTVLDLKR